MDPLTDEDINFITEETFDFGVNFPAESQGISFKNDTNEEALIGPVKHLERCVAMGIDVNSKNGNQQKANETVLKWSPLSAEKLVEIVKEANRLANQFEKCALKEKENANKQGKEGRSGDRSNLGKGNSKAKLRIVREERERKHSQRSPRRETFVVLDSPNKALLPSVDLSSSDPKIMSENSPFTSIGKVHSDIQSQSTNCKIEQNSECGCLTSDNPTPGRETNLPKESKDVIKKSVLPKPSGLKLPSALNRKGNAHSTSPIKPYQYSPSKESRTFASAASIKQTKVASLNNSVKRPDISGKSPISRSNSSKVSMVPGSKMSTSSISSKTCTEGRSKQLTGASRPASVGTSSRLQPPSKLIPPGNHLKPGTFSHIHTGIKIQRANSEVLKSKTPEQLLKTKVASTRHPNAPTSATQSRLLPPKKGISSHIKR
uniref:Proline/serine-rich coiled-coil protein 1 n=1 Tax=Callorhinchus milii TaxID=7868 RepID=V9KPX9_CALMI